VFDSSLRTPLVYAIAVRYQTPLWRAGALLRAGCMAGFWVLLLWFPAGSAARVPPCSRSARSGAVTAWAHNRSSLLDFLVDRDIPGLSAVARHLIGARQRAAADLSGLLEGFGIISVALLFAGPVAVRPLPAIVYELGTVLIVVHVWSAFLQAMTDSSWYSPDVPPGRAVLLLRPVMPLIVAAILFAILGYPIYWEHEAVPGGLFGVILACAVVLLLLPFTLVYELILRAARDALGLLARRYRAEDAVTVHSLVKNAAYALISEVDADSGAGAETRSLAREMLALTEEARLLALGRTADLGGVELLWHCVTRVLPSGGQITAELDPGQPYGAAQRDRLPAGPALPGGPDDQRVEGGRAADRGRRQGGRAARRGPAADRAAGRRRRPGDAAGGARQSGHEPGRHGRAPAGILRFADVFRPGRGRDQSVRAVAVGMVRGALECGSW
jgi:hypothetical protein